MGVVAQHVRETVVMDRQSNLPGIAAIFSGLMTLRGRSIPVVNLSRLLGRTVASYNLALILESEGNALALPVAEVLGYQQYEGKLTEGELFSMAEIAYEDVEVLSLPALMAFANTRLQTI